MVSRFSVPLPLKPTFTVVALVLLRTYVSLPVPPVSVVLAPATSVILSLPAPPSTEVVAAVVVTVSLPEPSLIVLIAAMSVLRWPVIYLMKWFRGLVSKS